MELLFANNATSSLASGINASATSLSLAAGTGALFPSPASGEGFFMTIQDAATQLTDEIVLCTLRVGDVCTVVRAQQATAAVTWNAGDLVQQLVTQGDLEAMIQPDQLQEGEYTACQGVGTNSITATLESGLTALPDSLQFIMRAAAINTGACTLTLTLGSTVIASKAIKKFGAAVLSAGDIPAIGYPCQLVYSATLDAYILCNPSTSTSGSIAGGAANELLVQTGAGATGFIPAPTAAGSVLAFVGGVIAWAAAAVTSFNGRSGAVAPAAGDYTAAMVGAVPASAFQAPNVLLANPMFTVDPSGAVHQAGSRAIPSNVRTVITYPHAYGTQCVSIVVSCDSAAAAIRVENLNRTSFAVTCNASNINWSSDGF